MRRTSEADPLSAILSPFDDTKFLHWHIIPLVCAWLHIKPTRVVEVGVYKGRCAARLQKAWPYATLYLVDPWQALEANAMTYDNSQEQWDEILMGVARRFRRQKRVRIYKMPSTEAVKWIPDNLDLVFVDGMHTYDAVKEDIAHWLPKVRPGGLLTGHDYKHHGRNGGVGRAVDEMLGRDNIWTGPDRVWVYQKGEI